MNPALLTAILKDIVIPELASFIAAHYARTGELPTESELQNQIDSLSAKLVMKSEAFIAQVYKDHPELDPTTVKK